MTQYTQYTIEKTQEAIKKSILETNRIAMFYDFSCHVRTFPLKQMQEFLEQWRRGRIFHTGKFQYPISIIEGYVAIGCKVFTYEEWMGGKLFEVGIKHGHSKSNILKFQPKLQKMYLDFMKNCGKFKS
jgi:hypothetical protein